MSAKSVLKLSTGLVCAAVLMQLPAVGHAASNEERLEWLLTHQAMTDGNTSGEIAGKSSREGDVARPSPFEGTVFTDTANSGKKEQQGCQHTAFDAGAFYYCDGKIISGGMEISAP